MLIPVVLSGGAGTRLWPVSRAGHPKPFMRLADGETLLGKTYARAMACSHGGEVLTVTNRDYYFQAKDCWHATVPGSHWSARYLLEPMGRNTAPAVLMAALAIEQWHGREAVMLVLAADHAIQQLDAFVADVDRATALASSGHLVTFGIPPTAPETGYGYIRTGAALPGGGQVVDGFVEKPDAQRAAAMLAQGGHFWNSGMFCLQVGVLIDAFRVHAPDLLERGIECWGRSQHAGPESFNELDAASFGQMHDISIDYAIMEKSDRVAMVEASFDWSDIGSWSALAALAPSDHDGNRSVGDVINIDSRGCYVQSEDRVVAVIGLEDLVVIDTPDALLVGRKQDSQKVKQVVEQLKRRGHESYRLHRTVARPWGAYTVLEEGERYKIKRIEVRPGASLSLQMHHHRSEHWIVVRGMARVTNGEQVMLVNANESTYIPAGHRHRLENPGIIDLVMIEVQSGEYLGEDDIVRFHDSYGRLCQPVHDLSGEAQV